MAEQNTRIRGTPDDPGVGPGLVLTGSTQSFDPPSRYVIVSTAGTITGKLVGDANDVAYVLPVGCHKLAFKSVASTTTLVGFITR